MPKRKASATVLVADGSGGMRQVSDLRFEAGDWPIERVIPSDMAEAWMSQLHAEIEERGWNRSALSQLDAIENSGTVTIHTANGPSPPGIDIVWERTRKGKLRLRAKPTGDPQFPIDSARAFVERVDERQREGRTLRAHQRDTLTYHGLPWRGELWLDDDIRLGPPSRFPEALLGPQIVIVDAICEGIGQAGATASFESLVAAVRVFLGFVLGLGLKPIRYNSDWVYEVGADGRITDCAVRPIGYFELAESPEFPVAGVSRPSERRTVVRPGLGPMGIWPDMFEEWVPDDIESLWGEFKRLPDRKRDQLMRAGNAYQVARSMWPDQRTACATFLVVACEALKPTGRRNEGRNVYDVIAELIGPHEAERLRTMSPNPQTVRSRHVHHGELAAGELLPNLVNDYFADPSFDEMIDTLWSMTRICLIEWLRREAQAPPS